VKALVIAERDIKGLLFSFRFLLSIFMSMWAVVFLQLTRAPVRDGASLASIFFYMSLLSLGLALLSSTSDVISREREKGTLSILLSQPVSNLDVILGKLLTVVFCIVIFLSVNLISFAIAYPSAANRYALSLFVSLLLSELAMGGMILIASTLTTRSMLVYTFAVLFYLIPSIAYGIAFTVSFLSNPGLDLVKPFLQRIDRVSFFTMAVALGGLEVFKFSRTWLVAEPPILKFLPVNVNSQRVFYHLSNPTLFNFSLFDVVLSGVGLIAIFTLAFFISTMLFGKVTVK
jgi:ABC-type transport system involved in multi-copper enzyme maturation permease subunit